MFRDLARQRKTAPLEREPITLPEDRLAEDIIAEPLPLLNTADSLEHSVAATNPPAIVVEVIAPEDTTPARTEQRRWGVPRTPIMRFGIGIVVACILMVVLLLPWTQDALSPHLRIVDSRFYVLTTVIRTTVTIDASQFMTISIPPIELRSGDLVTVDYVSGQWTINTNKATTTEPYVDADGYPRRAKYSPLPKAQIGSLIAQIGSRRLFSIGRSATFTAYQGGQLKFQINDADCSICDQPFGDNDGSVTVQVEVRR